MIAAYVMVAAFLAVVWSLAAVAWAAWRAPLPQSRNTDPCLDEWEAVRECCEPVHVEVGPASVTAWDVPAEDAERVRAELRESLITYVSACEAQHLDDELRRLS